MEIEITPEEWWQIKELELKGILDGVDYLSSYLFSLQSHKLYEPIILCVIREEL